MSFVNFNSISEKIIDNEFFLKDSALTKEEVLFLKKHPRLLKKITSTSFIKKRYLYLLFLFSLVIMVFAKIVTHTQLFAAFPVLQDTVTDIGAGIAMEIFGATLVAYIMEILLERKVRENELLVKKISQNNETLNAN